MYVPTTFEALPYANISVVVFIHGFSNCVENCAWPEASGCNCTSTGDKRQAYGLIDSLEAAARLAPASLVGQSIFVAAEVAYDAASSAAGNWSQPGVFAAFLAEVLASPAVASLIGGPRTLATVSRVRVFSHSGGYNVIGAIATVGGVASVLEVVLLDSLYGDFDAFDSFLNASLAAGRIGLGASQVRFLSVYTDGGGTEAYNRAMVVRVQGWLAARNQSALLYADDTLAPLPPAAAAAHPILFKRSNFTHDDTCRFYFGTFLRYIEYGE